eukprot:gene14776-17462_t
MTRRQHALRQALTLVFLPVLTWSWGWEEVTVSSNDTLHTNETLNQLLLDSTGSLWGVGNFDTFYRSADHGATWTVSGSGLVNTTGEYAAHLYPNCEPWKFVWCSYSGVIMYNWNGITVDASGTAAWVVGNYGKIIRSLDSGATWSFQETGLVNDVVFEKVQQVGEGSRTAFVVGSGGTLLRTKNAGYSWERLYPGVGDANLTALHFVDATTGWVVGDLGYKDSGLTWSQRAELILNMDMHALYFLNESVGWVVGHHTRDEDRGVILFTVNAGDSWQPQEYSPNVALNAVHFINATYGVAAGSGGAVFRTVDGGGSWEALSAPCTTRDLHVTGMGFAVGEDGVVCRTWDWGATWIDRTSEDGNDDELSLHAVEQWYQAPEEVSYTGTYFEGFKWVYDPEDDWWYFVNVTRRSSQVPRSCWEEGIVAAGDFGARPLHSSSPDQTWGAVHACIDRTGDVSRRPPRSRPACYRAITLSLMLC